MTFFRTAALLACLSFPAAPQAHGVAQDDGALLQQFVAPFAIAQLEQHGGFLPFGAAMRSAGQIVALGGYDGADDEATPPPADIVRLLQADLAAGAGNGEYRATALAYDASVAIPPDGQPSDAIAIALDLQDGDSVILYLPYELRDGKVSVGAPFTRQGTATIFPVKAVPRESETASETASAMTSATASD